MNDLTPRQREILALLAQGYSKKEVAHELHIALDTVKTTLYNARLRLGARNTAHAVYLVFGKGVTMNV